MNIKSKNHKSKQDKGDRKDVFGGKDSLSELSCPHNIKIGSKVGQIQSMQDQFYE